MNEAQLTALYAAAYDAQLQARVLYGQAVRAYHAAGAETQHGCGLLNLHMIETRTLANLTAADPTGDAASAVFESLRLPYCLRESKS